MAALLLLAVGVGASAQDDSRIAPVSAVTRDDLRAELARLRKTTDLPEESKAPLELAERALERAAAGGADAQRVKQIARAALALADRRLMWKREKAELRAAETRRVDARLRAKRAREALRVEKARLKALATPPEAAAEGSREPAR